MPAIILFVRYSYPTLIGSLIVLGALFPEAKPGMSDSKTPVPETRTTTKEGLVQAQVVVAPTLVER